MPPLAPAPPVDPIVIERGFQPAPYDWLPSHRGVDLRARPGQTVRAPTAGTVVFAGPVAGRPVVTVRSAQGIRWSFEPVRPASVVGTRVRRAGVIGHIGEGGHCTARCLHFGARVRGEYVDPLGYLGISRIVLKPLDQARGWAFR